MIVMASVMMVVVMVMHLITSKNQRHCWHYQYFWPSAHRQNQWHWHIIQNALSSCVTKTLILSYRLKMTSSCCLLRMKYFGRQMNLKWTSGSSGTSLSSGFFEQVHYFENFIEDDFSYCFVDITVLAGPPIMLLVFSVQKDKIWTWWACTFILLSMDCIDLIHVEEWTLIDWSAGAQLPRLSSDHRQVRGWGWWAVVWDKFEVL